jgi:hypothetical protein
MMTPAAARAVLSWLALAALFMPFSSPNVIATVYDVVVPEVRSTAQAVGTSWRTSGRWRRRPAGFLSIRYGRVRPSCGPASPPVAVFCLLPGALFTIEHDIRHLRKQMSDQPPASRLEPRPAPGEPFFALRKPGIRGEM